MQADLCVGSIGLLLLVAQFKVVILRSVVIAKVMQF